MDQDFVAQTALDQMVGTDQSQFLKALIPYLPPKGQQLLSVYTKAKEFSNTMALFSRAQPDMQICASPMQDASPLEMMNDIRRFCYGESRRKIDQMVNMMSVLEMVKILGSDNQKG